MSDEIRDMPDTDLDAAIARGVYGAVLREPEGHPHFQDHEPYWLYGGLRSQVLGLLSEYEPTRDLNQALKAAHDAAMSRETWYTVSFDYEGEGEVCLTLYTPSAGFDCGTSFHAPTKESHTGTGFARALSECVLMAVRGREG
jgi:hypothetical protein